MSFVNSYLKAHLAGLGAALSLVVADLNAGHLTLTDWYGIVGAALGVAAAVAVVPNGAPKAAALAPVAAPVAAPAAQDVVAPAAAA